MRGPLFNLVAFLSVSARQVMARQPEIIVIGTGAAGLSSAIEAATRGANVLLLEKTAQGGGNSAKASSGINGAETTVQLEKGVADSIGLFEEDTDKAGQDLGDTLLVHKLAAESKEAIRFLKDDIEIPLTDVIQLGGHSTPRTHRLSTQAPIGFSLVKALKTKLQTIPNVRTEYSAEVLDLLYADSDGERTVHGVSYRNAAGEMISQSADSVVIATGGMAFDHSEDGIFAEFAPELRGLATSSGPQADGAGIKLGRKAGAELIHMDKIQIHPTGLVDLKDIGASSKILGPEALRGVGGLLVLKNGQRFVNELARRGHVTQVIREKADELEPLSTGREQKSAFIMLNAVAVEAFSEKMFGFYVGRGIFRKYSNAMEMCTAEGITCDQLERTFESYAQLTEGTADEFGKTHFPIRFKSSEEIWVANITPVIHYTMGGMKINERAVVQRARSSTTTSTEIKGLYAAGECTGGVHGGDRLAGNSLLECVVFGRTAGVSAVSDAMGKLGPNDEL